MGRKRAVATNTPISIKEAQEQLEKESAEKKVAARELAERKKVQKAQRDFDRAISVLPTSASVARELNWIRSHPAMSRRDRQKDDSPVLITANDILEVPHGRAPSQSAVYQLQHWVNRPEAFYAQMLQEDRKKAKDTPDTLDKEVPEEVSNIDEMLMLLEGAVEDDGAS